MKKTDFSLLAEIYGMFLGCIVFPEAWGIALLLVSAGAFVHRLTAKHQYTKLFEDCGLGTVLLREHIVEDEREIFRFAVPPGKGLKDFQKEKDIIENHTGKAIAFDCKDRSIIMEVSSVDIETFDYEHQPREGLEIVIGRTKTGEALIYDPKKLPHLLVAGQTGSGKSGLTRVIISQLCLMDPKKVEISLIDMKGGVEYALFRSCKNVINFARTPAEAPKIIKSVQQEMIRRYDNFYAGEMVNIEDSGLPYHFIVIDEYAVLLGDKEVRHMIDDILARVRAAGVLMIISTQRPSADVIPGNLKQNLTAVAGLRCNNRISSEVCIGESGLERLENPGHGIFMPGHVEYQVPRLTVDAARELIASTYVDKPDNVLHYDGVR
jgi:S-DNA-T family DNA segregation ATPase FtsK/SpoIIIE